MSKGMLVDTSKCMACRGCQAACKSWNQLPAEETSFEGSYENPPGFSSRTWMKITFNEYEDDNGDLQWRFGRQGCMHCNEAGCMYSCPVGAIERTDLGTVKINEEKCISCNYCVANCPFNVVGLDRQYNVAMKCTFCYDRMVQGMEPACVSACPTDALVVGDRAEIARMAQMRADELNSNGNPRAQVYGLDEVGGTGMVYVLEDSPDKYKLPEEPTVPLSAQIWNSLFKPLRVLVVIALGFGLWANGARSKRIQSGKSS